MKFNELRRQIYTGLLPIKFNNTLGLGNVNRIIASCLLFSFIENYITLDTSYQGRVSSLVSQYGQTYKSLVEGLRNTYVSYFLMKSYIQSKGFNSFLDVSLSDINTIYKLYLDKTEVVLFDQHIFSQYMYNVENLSPSEYERLRKIHFNIMVPIIMKYIDHNDKKPADVEMYATSITSDIVGKEILFKVQGIKLSEIVTDIEMSPAIMKYIYSISVYNDYICIIVK